LTTQELKAEASAAERVSEPAQGKSNLALWVHLAPLIAAVVSIWLTVALFLLWLPGLLIRNSATSTEFEKRHATESMNFQLTILIFSVVAVAFSIFTLGIGVLLVVPAAFAVSIAALIFMIMGAVAASSGREFRYPVSIRFVK
jgi:hypothetical protein